MARGRETELWESIDKACEDNETRQLALVFGFIPVVPRKSNRFQPRQYDKAM